MKKTTSGFTIVELLIVIVVIAILAAISVVAYTGIQQRANNSKTLSAVSAYIKALQMYKADNGQFPPATSCLGIGYRDTRCHSNTSTGYIENGGNLNTSYLSQYFGSAVPTPATNLGDFDSATQLGGALYAWNNASYGGAGNGGIGLYHQGSGNCPEVGSLNYVSAAVYVDGSGRWCRYSMN